MTKEDKEGWLSGRKHRVRKATAKRNIGGSNPSPSTNLKGENSSLTSWTLVKTR